MLVLLYALWLILSGKITLEIILVGVALTALIYIFMKVFMGYNLKKEVRLYKNAGLFIAYLCLLLWEILKANINVMIIVLNKKRKIHQAIVYFDIPLKSELLRVILANSITLTPGTITVKLEGSRYCVHCLDEKMIEDIEDGGFMKLLKLMDN